MSTPSDMFLFFGRFHPLVVHLPIGLLLVLLILELLSRSKRFQHANASSGFILSIAAPGAVLAAVCGWLLSQDGGYQAQLLSWHKWTGIATAAFCVLAAVFFRLELRRPYRWTLVCGTLVLLVTSHFGGSLTHGSDYLAQHAPGPLKTMLGFKSPDPAVASAPKTVGAGQAPVYAQLVRPVLEENCLGCHGPEKSKGGLRLDSLTAMLKGGENGPAIAPGKPGESLLLRRVRLPLSSDDHMPPDGKPQPDADDIALLEWWIQAGVPTNKTVAELKPTATIARILQERLGTSLPTPPVPQPKPAAEAIALAQSLEQELGVVLSPLAPGEALFQCNASLAGTNFGDAYLSRLSSIGPNLAWLDLGGTAVTDQGLAALESMPNLKRLHLERTGVTDAGLRQIASLAQLEYLNLHHTSVTDEGVRQLKGLANLKQLYLWESKVSPEAAAEFAESRVDKTQLARWREQIQELNHKITSARFVMDIGATNIALTTNPSPVNTQCPVSGKPIDKSKTVLHNDKLVAFCCDDCKAKFQQDPKAFAAKLEVPATAETRTENSK